MNSKLYIYLFGNIHGNDVLDVPSYNGKMSKNKPNCAISSGFAVTYCTNVGLGLAGRLFSHYIIISI
jgi:hypothetical protein